MTTSRSRRLEMLRQVLCGGCVGLSVGWLLAAGWSSTTEYGHLQIGAGQVAVVLAACVAAVVVLVGIGRRVEDLHCGFVAVLGAVVICMLAAWAGLTIAMGGLHRVAPAMDEVVTLVMVAGCGMAFVSLVMPLRGTRRRALLRSGGYIAGLALLMVTPFLFER